MVHVSHFIMFYITDHTAQVIVINYDTAAVSISKLGGAKTEGMV